ncbi:efflux RND transporter periplasmic adaptor subunit [Pseudomonas asiatica]|uniref:efflux RND transporter periplasmic adaptor subunit n=1 Tax=unclassified Pseudomonas TaxID=196821 RepID=UPI001E4514E9|nr:MULTISPECIES: efflux RND transporter periplasmic adaptor subunit [Pseudomonas]MCK2119330.1 efflux RND transporter periplasmic adaptor subunit [Pseudomonas sp. PNPG3]MDD1980658.1 efflux RND transporter periplasmic adaptor subunit [Pseudomonas asiatica]MDH0134007.1 efflux RND transporter periplasmic adaptor subunit [Pseudomonas asiatica]MDM9589203.1 efflux RND transporter periplasmic adaptor subunit [Pseudomonas asiatica]MDY4310261.1 efflux RND transporter periplasmic adaptor subunit [Pseudom
MKLPVTGKRALFALSLAALLVGCGPQAQESAPAAPSVVVSQPLKSTISDWDSFTGRFEATDSVEVRSRVSGYLEKVAFRDGAIVKKGDLLFVIDSRSFQAAVTQAQGKLAQARSQQALAEQEYARAKVLIDSRTIAQSLYDQRLQAREAARAEVLSAEGALASARLDLEFTRITAPMSGRISRKLISEGNLVNGGSNDATLLTTIVSLDPIDIYFDIDEQSYLKYRRQSAGNIAGSQVRIALPGELQASLSGRMDFIDNRLDPSTGTLRQRARVSNPDLALSPGQFGRVQFSARPAYEALLVPDTAVGIDATRKVLYVLDAQNRVELRPVQLGKLHDGLREVVSGLQADDRVIVDGLQRVRAGDTAIGEQRSLTRVAAANPAQEATL